MLLCTCNLECTVPDSRGFIIAQVTSVFLCFFIVIYECYTIIHTRFQDLIVCKVYIHHLKNGLFTRVHIFIISFNSVI